MVDVRDDDIDVERWGVSRPKVEWCSLKMVRQTTDAPEYEDFKRIVK